MHACMQMSTSHCPCIKKHPSPTPPSITILFPQTHKYGKCVYEGSVGLVDKEPTDLPLCLSVLDPQVLRAGGLDEAHLRMLPGVPHQQPHCDPHLPGRWQDALHVHARGAVPVQQQAVRWEQPMGKKEDQYWRKEPHCQEKRVGQGGLKKERDNCVCIILTFFQHDNLSLRFQIHTQFLTHLWQELKFSGYFKLLCKCIYIIMGQSVFIH